MCLYLFLGQRQFGMRILSYQYLQWQIEQLGLLVEELDPNNLHRLLKALEGLDGLIDDLLEVLVFSGNKNSAPYKVAKETEEKRLALIAILEEPPGEEDAFELGIIYLQRSICSLAGALRAKSAVAFPFSMN